MILTPGHDGRLITDVTAEWARLHGRPFSLTLTGPVGGQWSQDSNGEHLELDALEFCWILAGRHPAPGCSPPKSRSDP